MGLVALKHKQKLRYYMAIFMFKLYIICKLIFFRHLHLLPQKAMEEVVGLDLVFKDQDGVEALEMEVLQLGQKRKQVHLPVPRVVAVVVVDMAESIIMVADLEKDMVMVMVTVMGNW